MGWCLVEFAVFVGSYLAGNEIIRIQPFCVSPKSWGFPISQQKTLPLKRFVAAIAFKISSELHELCEVEEPAVLPLFVPSVL